MGETPDVATPRLEALLRETLRCVQAHGPSGLARGGEILLDLELDGVRCVFTRSQPPALRSLAHLSAREQEIARMVAKGYPNKTIAAVLEISGWTVNTHLRRIFAKLGVHNRAAMVAAWLEENARDAPDVADKPDFMHARALGELEKPITSSARNVVGSADFG